MKKSIVIIIGVLVVASALAWWSWGKEEEVIAPVGFESFEECVAAGNPVMESYPRQCRSGTVTYFEDIILPPKASTTPSDEPRACTMEAKLCPDGSYVGRTGPNCEFTPCP